MPGQPIEGGQNGILNYLQTRVFEIAYRNKFRVNHAFVLADNLHDAKIKCEGYCGRFGLKFISVVPFFMDLDKISDDEKSE